MDGSLAALVLRVCCSTRCMLTVLSSVALFLMFLTTSATNYLSMPWTEISSSQVLAQSANSTTLLWRHELRSLSGNPLVFSCAEVLSNATPPLPPQQLPCQRNATAAPLDSAAAAGFDELVVKRTTLSLVLFALGSVVLGIASVLCFQFHACRLDEAGRPLPGSRLCLRSPRQVVLAFLAAVAFTTACGALTAHSTRFYAAEVTARWQAALPPGAYSVSLGGGAQALARTAVYAWSATAVLLLASLLGPLRWGRDAVPFEEDGGGLRQAARQQPASPRSAAFALREIVTLPVEAVPSSASAGHPCKTDLGWPLPRAVYAQPEPRPPGAAAAVFSFATPLRRGGLAAT